MIPYCFCALIFDPSIKTLTHCTIFYFHSIHIQMSHVSPKLKQKKYLHDFLLSLNTHPDVICITETKIKEVSSNISLPGYSFLNFNSSTNAGGVALYICDKYQFRLKSNQVKLTDCESLVIELTLTKLQSKKLNIGVMYRHPRPN